MKSTGTRQETEQAKRLREQDRQRSARLKKAAVLIEKYPDKASLLAGYYGEGVCTNSGNGIIFFDPDSRKEVVGAEKMTYDEYLDLQLGSLGRSCRSGFINGLLYVLLEFKGQIEKINAKYICFQRIFISGMYPDGTMFEGKEDHVWMEKAGFEGLAVGDSVSFYAEVYRYVKKGNGKQIDYGLRNPEEVKKIEGYRLPTDEALRRQMMEQIACETCWLTDHCDRLVCLLGG